jgi:hypothetical protein
MYLFAWILTFTFLFWPCMPLYADTSSMHFCWCWTNLNEVMFWKHLLVSAYLPLHEISKGWLKIWGHSLSADQPNRLSSVFFQPDGWLTSKDFLTVLIQRAQVCDFLDKSEPQDESQKQFRVLSIENEVYPRSEKAWENLAWDVRAHVAAIADKLCLFVHVCQVCLCVLCVRPHIAAIPV